MKNNTTRGLNAVIFRLSEDLAQELMKPLGSLCQVTAMAGCTPFALGGVLADVIFCGADVSVVQQLRSVRPEAPIVVVSRQPEVSGWLDSMEAGAADYCAAPFEFSQVKWILETARRCSHS